MLCPIIAIGGVCVFTVVKSKVVGFFQEGKFETSQILNIGGKIWKFSLAISILDSTSMTIINLTLLRNTFMTKH